jgi:hypothetical protein
MEIRPDQQEPTKIRIVYGESIGYLDKKKSLQRLSRSGLVLLPVVRRSSSCLKDQDFKW